MDLIPPQTEYLLEYEWGCGGPKGEGRVAPLSFVFRFWFLFQQQSEIQQHETQPTVSGQ